MAKLTIDLALIIGAAIFAIWCIKKLVETYHNIKVLKDEEKHHGRYPRKNSGIAYNKNTQKLEGTSGEVILPF